MAFNASPSATLVLPDTDPLVPAMCPMCHTAATLSQAAVDAGADWQCTRCAQHWDAPRLAAVAAYAAWEVEHDRKAAATQPALPLGAR